MIEIFIRETFSLSVFLSLVAGVGDLGQEEKEEEEKEDEDGDGKRRG